MKKFALKAIVFLLIFLFLAFTIQWIIDTGLRKSNYSAEFKEWYEIRNGLINADVLIQGSSRAWVQISPAEFETKFACTAYNLGMDGQDFPVQKFRYDIYIKYNKKPKVIIQNVDIFTFQDVPLEYNYSQFIPYLDQDFIKRFGKSSFFSLKDFYIPLYKYSHSSGIKTAGVLNFFNKTVADNGKYKGFQAQNFPYDQKLLDTILSKSPGGKVRGILEKKAFAEFISFIKYCKKEQIDLILVYAPVQYSFQKHVINKDSIISVFSQISVQHDLKFLDYSESPIGRDSSLFYNFNHLNIKGVEVFNKQLVNDLKEEIVLKAERR